MYRAGGVRLLTQRLIEGGYVDGSAMTVTGQTLGEEAALAHETPGQDVIRTLDNPINTHGGLHILKGNLATNGAVVKLKGTEPQKFRGPARIFNREEDAYRCRAEPRDQGGRRGGHPLRRTRRRAGNARDASGDGGDCRAGTRQRRDAGHRRALLRRTRGLMIGHVAPEAAVGGAIGLLQEGDIINVDIEARSLNVELSDAELASARAGMDSARAELRGRRDGEIRPAGRAGGRRRGHQLRERAGTLNIH